MSDEVSVFDRIAAQGKYIRSLEAQLAEARAERDTNQEELIHRNKRVDELLDEVEESMQVVRLQNEAITNLRAEVERLRAWPNCEECDVPMLKRTLEGQESVYFCAACEAEEKQLQAEAEVVRLRRLLDIAVAGETWFDSYQQAEAKLKAEREDKDGITRHAMKLEARLKAVAEALENWIGAIDYPGGNSESRKRDLASAEMKARVALTAAKEKP